MTSAQSTVDDKGIVKRGPSQRTFTVAVRVDQLLVVFDIHEQDDKEHPLYLFLVSGISFS
ncbi:unnamed protein product [Musa acuminata subsp. burmannicoides]